MSAIWSKQTANWKDPESWGLPLSRWLRSYMNGRGIRHLQRMREQNICWDDSDWLKQTQTILSFDVDYVSENLGNALADATVRTYHGCRTKDAGVYHRDGIRLNAPNVLEDEVRRIVKEEEQLRYLQIDIERRLREFEHKERDTGKLYLALDDRTLVDGGGHYLLYGSEWIQCVLGFEAHRTLLQRGCPTVIFVSLPLSMVTEHQRHELARALLQEWTRIKVNKPDWVPELDFTFYSRKDIPSSLVAGHSHPEVVYDPFHGNKRRHIDQRQCPSCKHE